MKTIIKQILCILLCVHYTYSRYGTSGLTLLLVQIVHRHGDRTPTQYYHGDPYANYPWPDGMGELTPNGKLRMFRAGQQFREHYGQWPGVSPKHMRQRSTAYGRTLESAQAFAAGLYPQRNRTHPLAIYTVPKAIDGMMYYGATCPAADRQIDRILNSKPVSDYLVTKRRFTNRLHHYLPTANLTTLTDYFYLHDTLYTELNYDQPLPAPHWLRAMGAQQTMRELSIIKLAWYEFVQGDPLIQRLRSGLLINQIIFNARNVTEQVMAGAYDGDLQTKVYEYSTHDDLVYSLVRGMSGHSSYPTYGSAIVFELHRVDNEFVILAYFWHNDLQYRYQIWPVSLRVCPGVGVGAQPVYGCELNRFAASVKHLIPDDWSRECGLNYTQTIYSR